MKNFIQRETMNFTGYDLEGFCRFLGTAFLARYSQVEGVQVSAEEIPYAALEQGAAGFSPSGPERATARVELERERVVEAVSGIRGFRLLRLGGSAFKGFVRDEYTTLPDLLSRPLHIWLDLDWRYTEPAAAFNEGQIVARARHIVRDVFGSIESGSIQQLITRIATRLLEETPEIVELDMEANNRTWDTIAERGDELGIYTEPRPPYGVLGLRIKR
jgi:urate oxidase